MTTSFPFVRSRTALPAVVLALAFAGYTSLNLERLAHFEPLEWDLAIFGQGVWLLSRAEAPQVTIRGLSLFGDHATFVHVPIALLYRILGPLAGVWLLVLLHSAALALTGALLHRRARCGLGDGPALLVLVAYLLYPPLQYTWGEYYQPVALALAPLVLAFEAVEGGHSRRALLWSMAALSCMENVAVTVAALGLYAISRGRRRLGLALFACACGYVALLLGLFFPWSNRGVGYVYADRLYGDFAQSLPEAVAYLLRPDHLAARLCTAANGRYLLGVLVPVGFLPVAAPAVLAVGAQLPLNLVSSWPYAHEIRYHYVALVIPFVFLALVASLRSFPPLSAGRRLACGALLGGVLAGQALYAPSGLRYQGDEGRRRDVNALMQLIPREMTLSAHYPFLPRVCARRSLYMFPELGQPEADAVLVDLRLDTGDRREASARARLDSPEYRVVARTDSGVVLYVRSCVPLGGLPAPPAGRSESPPSARPAAPGPPD